MIGIALFFLLEIGAIVLFAISDTQKKQDTVAVNRVVQSVSAHFVQLNASVLYTELDYVVTDRAGNVLFRTKEGLSETLNEAIAHRDTILDITVGERVVGKVFIANDSATLIASQRKTLLWTLAGGIFAQCLLCGAYFFFAEPKYLKTVSQVACICDARCGRRFGSSAHNGSQQRIRRIYRKFRSYAHAAESCA